MVKEKGSHPRHWCRRLHYNNEIGKTWETNYSQDGCGVYGPAVLLLLAYLHSRDREVTKWEESDMDHIKTRAERKLAEKLIKLSSA